MTATPRTHRVFVDESLDPDDVAYSAYCTCGWSGPWLPAAQFKRTGVIEAHNTATQHGTDHLVAVGVRAPLGETA